MAAISSIVRAPAASAGSRRQPRSSAFKPTRAQLFVIALFAAFVWLMLVGYVSVERGARRQMSFDTPTQGHVYR